MVAKHAPRVILGVAILGLALLVGIAGIGGRHGNYGGIVSFVGALVGALPGAIDGARRPSVRALILVTFGAVIGAVLGFAVTAWRADSPIGAVAVGGLVFGLGGVVIPLVIVGSALTWFAPRLGAKTPVRL